MSLRRVFFIAASVTSVLAIGAAVALMAIAGNLRQITNSLNDGIQSLNVVRSLELALLTHERSNDDVVRAALEREMSARLNDARAFVADQNEARSLQAAAEGIDRYLRANREHPSSAKELRAEAFLAPALAPSLGPHFPTDAIRALDDTPMGVAFKALEALATVNVDQATAGQLRARQLDRFSDLLGTATAFGLVVGVLLVALWMQRSALQPLLRLRTAIERLGSGNRESRAPETGPSELRSVAVQFNQMAAALERQHSQQLAFLAGIVHDLRNPLSALSASMMLFTPERPLPTEARIRHVSELVKRQVGRLNRMVGDLLDAARIEAGELELRFEARDPNRIAREVWELFSDSSPQHTLHLEPLAEATPLSCDPLRLEQVLTNLVSNAIKYSPSGGRVTIAVERTADRQVGFRVTDQGVGIAPADLAQVFEPFRRTATSRNTAPGVGLGLSVAKRIVEAHGGRILIDSQVGQGTSVRVWFRESQRAQIAVEPDAAWIGTRSTAT